MKNNSFKSSKDIRTDETRKFKSKYLKGKGTFSIIKKVFQAGILSTVLVTQNTVFTSCTQPNNQQIIIPNEEQTQDIVSKPYNKRIGNGNYIIHNFIGKEPKIDPFTAHEDIQNYYDMGEKYIEATYHKFHQTFCKPFQLFPYDHEWLDQNFPDTILSS